MVTRKTRVGDRSNGTETQRRASTKGNRLPGRGAPPGLCPKGHDELADGHLGVRPETSRGHLRNGPLWRPPGPSCATTVRVARPAAVGAAVGAAHDRYQTEVIDGLPIGYTDSLGRLLSKCRPCR